MCIIVEEEDGWEARDVEAFGECYILDEAESDGGVSTADSFEDGFDDGTRK